MNGDLQGWQIEIVAAFADDEANNSAPWPTHPVAHPIEGIPGN
jgi:hypothetical protein